MIYRLFPCRCLSLGLCALVVLMALSVAGAELPSARLLSVFPPGAKQGSTVEVTITGQDLEDVSGLHFSDARIAAKAGAANKFSVTVGADVPAGIYDVRAIGRYGVSNPRSFVVGSLNETFAKPGNTSMEQAAPISVGETTSAAAQTNAIQYYKLPLKKDQRIFAEVEARVIDSRMEPSILLADASGNDRVISRRGELIDFFAPADGDYFLKVYDFTYQGGPEFFYRLTVSAGPHIDFIVPPAGLPGSKCHYTLFGRNLPGGKPAPDRSATGPALEQLGVDIELPADPQGAGAAFSYIPSSASLMDGLDYRLATPQGISNAIRMGFAGGPVVLRDQAIGAGSESKFQKLAVPCEVAGRFVPRSRPQGFTFDAPANSTFSIEVISSRLGNPTAPFLLVQRVGKDSKGAEKITDVQEVYESPVNAGGPEFRTSSRDPAYRLEAKEAGAYRLILRDLFTTPADEGSLEYRLCIRRPTPDFRLVAFPASPVLEKDSKDAPNSTALLRRGGLTPIQIVALRQDGFDGEIRLKVEGLPPGVTCAATSIAPSASSATLFLSAADNAPAGFGSLQITGASSIGNTAVTRQSRLGTVSTSAYDTQNKGVEVASRRARELFVSVVPEPAPLAISLGNGAPLETCVFSKISIPVKIIRRGEITGPVAIKLAGHPLLAPVKDVTIAPPADTASFDLDLAQVKLPAGVYDLNVETLAKLKYRAGVEAAKEAEAAAKQAEKAAAESAAAAKTAAAKLAALKPDAPEFAAAKKASEELAKNAKDAEAEKVAAAAKAKDLTAKAAAKDYAASFYSPPVRLVVAASPIRIAPLAAVSTVAGAKAELPVEIIRLYGFADAVELSVIAPAVKGIAGKMTLAKDKLKENLPIQSNAATPAGEYAIKIEAKLKLNGQTITVEQPFTLKVTEKKAQAKPATTKATTKPK